METCHLKDFDRIDGEPIEFEWTIFPGLTTLGILDEMQKMMTESECEPEQFNKIIFMSMTLTLIGQNEATKNIVLRMLSKLLSMVEDSRKDIGRFWSLAPGSEKKMVRNTSPQTRW